MTRKPLVLAGTFVVVLAKSSALGQHPADPPAGPESEAIEFGSFGSDTQELWVDAIQFVPHPNTPWVNWAEGYRYNGAAVTVEIQSPVDLPAGARITAITCYFYDTDTENILMSLFRSEYNIATNVPGGDQVGGFIQSFGTGGYQRVTVAYDETVRYREGNFAYFYNLNAQMPEGNALRLRGCRILWNRQVSAAPVSATFSDVPTNHPYFRFVEALSASGITAGCAPNLYCVNNPITRGEMAVFLAVALGLHFPF